METLTQQEKQVYMYFKMRDEPVSPLELYLSFQNKGISWSSARNTMFDLMDKKFLIYTDTWHVCCAAE